MENSNAVRTRLAESDPEFKRLQARHQELESRLEELQSRKYLSDEERLEETNIKKRKLALKDQMEAMVRKAGS